MHAGRVLRLQSHGDNPRMAPPSPAPRLSPDTPPPLDSATRPRPSSPADLFWSFTWLALQGKVLLR